MARMPDGWIIPVESDGLEVRFKEPRELVMCKNCLYFCDMSDMGKTDQCSYRSVMGPDGEIQFTFYTIPEAYCAWAERRE